jgi:hypothetical protein
MWLAAVLVMVSFAPGRADDTPLAPMPWHLVDIWWDLGRDAPFESYAIDVTITGEIPPSSNLYIAPIGLGHLSKTPFYGGIQTQVDGTTRKDPRLRKLGPGLIFSMWNERELDAIRPSLGGYFQSSGHEGDFVSIRRPYAWKPGRYTYKIIRMDRQEVDGKTYTWVGVFVYSRENDENVFVGALRFPGENLVLDRKIAGFVEVYGPRIDPATIPHFTVQFGNLTINSEPVVPVSADAIYPPGVPDSAEARAEDGQVRIRIGDPIANRTRRTVRLISGSAGKP